MYLIILFIPPLYFVIKGKWGAFILNSILYALAFATIWFFFIGIFFWILAVGHAFWHLRKELMLEQARMIAQEMSKIKE
jgi:hypothetical protein